MHTVCRRETNDTDSNAVDLEQLESQTKRLSSAWSQRIAAPDAASSVDESQCVASAWTSTDKYHGSIDARCRDDQSETDGGV